MAMMSPFGCIFRIAWPGGEIHSNKHDAARKFFLRKLATGKEFTEHDKLYLKSLGSESCGSLPVKLFQCFTTLPVDLKTLQQEAAEEEMTLGRKRSASETSSISAVSEGSKRQRVKKQQRSASATSAPKLDSTKMVTMSLDEIIKTSGKPKASGPAKAKQQKNGKRKMVPKGKGKAANRGKPRKGSFSGRKVSFG